jgi:hypothetical protein
MKTLLTLKRLADPQALKLAQKLAASRPADQAETILADAIKRGQANRNARVTVDNVQAAIAAARTSEPAVLATEPAATPAPPLPPADEPGKG